MPNPSIVMAALDDKELQASINQMVANFDEGLQKMLDHTNKKVGEIQQSLQKIGSTNFGDKGSNDGGVAKQTKQHKDLTEAVSKETQKLQDLQQSLSGASDREQNFISQKERAASTIAQENELLSKQQSELAALKAQEQQLVDAHQRDMQARQQNAAAIEKQRGQVKFYEEELNSLQAKLATAQEKEKRYFDVVWQGREAIQKKLRSYTNDKYGFGYDEYEYGKTIYYKTEKDVRSLIDALSKLKETNKKSGFLDEILRPFAEGLSPSRDYGEIFKRLKDEISINIKSLQEIKKGLRGDARADVDARISAAKELLNVYKTLSSAQDSLNKTYSKESLHGASNVGGIKKDIEETQKAYDIAKQKLEQLTQSTQQSNQIRQESLNLDAKIQEKLKEISETRGRIATATREQSEADKNASQAAKEKSNIQSQVANQEKQVAEAKKQLATATQQHTAAEAKSSLMTKEQTMTLDQQQATMRKVIDVQNKLFYARTMKLPTDQYDMQIAKLERIQSMLERYRRGEASFTPSQVSVLEKEERNLSHLLGQVNTAQQQTTQTTQQQESVVKNIVASERDLVEEEKQRLALTREIAKEAREAMARNGASAYLTPYRSESGAAYIYAENDARAKGLTIEQQIANILRENDALYQASARSASMVVEEEKKITQEQDKRKSYKAPVTTINDSFKQLTANALGVHPSEIESTSTRIAKMTTYVRQLETAYSNLTRTEQNSPFGMQLRQEIQQISRAIQKARSEMSRPINLKDAFSGSENTLDDIAYKMRRLASYRSGLNVDTQKKEIQQVNDEYNRLKKRMDEVMQKNQQMIASNTALGRSWNYMKNRLAFYFTVGASTQFVKSLIEVRSQYEMNERALGILINSAERGTQIFNELSQMALVSPYTLIELSAAAKQLTAYDVAAKDVVNTTRRLADMAAAVGIPIERLTYALGQVKAYGYLNARDARMFANAGIPLVKNLSEYYAELEGRLVSTADIYDRIKKKQIGYEEVMSTISKMTDEGGKFFDFQAKMAETLKVQLANLTLAWNNMLNDMGEESQGVLVGGIGALKQMFLHWKDIEHILTEVVVALGAYKAYQLMTTRLMGATSASLNAQILAMKRNNAAMLEKQALTRKLTVDELRQVSAQNQVTAADYRNALSGKQLTKQKALLLVALNKNNVQLKAALVNMGLLTAEEAANVTTGRALAIVFKSIGLSIRNAAMAMIAFMVSNWWLIALGGIYELYHAWDSYNEHVAEINRSAAEHAKEAYESIKQYLEGDVISALQDNLTKGGKVSSDAEGQKAWDEMREKIELSSSASNVFIARLMQIDDINNRLSAGFGYLEDIQRVAGVMQTLEDDAIKVSTTTLGGLFGEGLKDDLQDFLKSKDAVISAYGDIGKAEEELKKQQKSGNVGIVSNLYDMQEFAKEVKKTTDSIYDIASREGFNTNQQREFFEREISETTQAEQLGIKEARIYRMQAEDEYYTYARKKLVERYDYEGKMGAWTRRKATEREIKALDEEFGSRKAMQESFFTWLTEKQDHAVKNMLRGKTQEEIKQGDWLKGSNAKWVEEMARKFSQEYGVSFDDLHRLVMNANTWSINIPVFFQTIGQPLTDVQRDYEARTGKKFSSNYLIKDAKSQVEIIDILKKKQKEVSQEMETARKAGGQYWEDNKQRYKEENDALVADIHAYNALTDAEEKANKKSGKGGSKKDILGDALAKEVQLIGEIQKRYKEYQQIGFNAQEAVTLATEEYGNTLKRTNATLAKYGIATKSSDELANMDIRKIRDYYKTLLEGAKNKDNAKGIEAIEKALASINVEISKLDYKKITDGLNNELGKLKEEYELAVELDANPEFGSVFADMFGINMETLPRTAQEYAERATKELNKYLSEKKSGIKIGNLLYLTDDDLRMFQERVETDGLSQEWVDNIIKAAKDVRDAWKKETSDTIKNWNSLVEKYGEIQAKITKINKDSSAQIKDIVMQYGSDKQKSLATRLYDNISKEQNPEEIEKLRKQIEDIVSEISEKYPIALKILVAIGNANKRQISQALWEDFKNGDLYTSTFEDMERVSTFTIKRILDELERLKNKVKDDPASMKALMKSMDDARKKLQERNPFKTLLESIKKLEGKRTAVKNAKTALDNAKKALDDAKEQDNQEEVQRNIKKVEEAEKVLSQTSDELTASLQELKKAQEGVSAAMQSLAGIISTTSDITKALGGSDDSVETLNDLAESINGVTEAAEGITDIVTGAESGNILTIIQGAQKTIEGTWKTIDTWLDNSDKRRTRSIERSQMAIKHLELAYIDLQHAVDKAYGMATIGAQKAAIANKELQLVELKRQLALEQGRKKKYRDNARIVELQQQIKELQYEIQDATDSIVNDLLGISSVGDAMENLMDGLIDALRSGEDAMAVFDENIDNMIANMIKKMYVTKFLQPWFENVWEQIQRDIDKRGGYAAKLAQEQLSLDDNQLRTQMANQRVFDFFEKSRREGYTGYFPSFQTMRNFFAKGITDEDLKAFRKDAQRRLTEATSPTMEDLKNYAGLLEEGRPVIENALTGLNEALKQLGIDKKSLELSSLQQGIQGITEDTAGALEAYMNGVSQQVYLQNDLLTQIRDAIVGFDMDVQTATMGEILLQLRSSYEVQMAIHGILEGVLTPSGRAFSVELMS